MNTVSENIDERILRLLNLEDVFDLDYDTYFNLIREAMVLGANKIPQEELAILANERKRIRGKKGRFKPKKQKITADKIATTKILKGSKKVSMLPAAISKPDISQDNLTEIGKPLQSISKTLSSFLKFRKKASEDDRKEKESQKRTKREEGLEGLKKGISAVSSAAKKMLAPFQSIIDRIWRFIFFTLLGRAFTQLMDWLGDPANKKKIDVLGRFLKDWWPTLLGAAVLFLTPFGAFVRKTLSLVGFFTGKLVKLIPRIAKAVKGLALNPWFAVPAAAVGLAAAANEVTGQRKAASVQTENKARAQSGKGLGVQGVGGVGDMGPTTPYRMLQGAVNGGQILKFTGGGINPGNGYEGIDSSTGQKVSGFGPDTQMIVAQPGEIVMNKKTVDAVGADNLLSLNRQYGGPGANKPKMGRLYNTGGMVGMQGGGFLNWLGRVLPNTGTAMSPGGSKNNIGYQDKFLGMNVGRWRGLPLNQTYRQQDVDRYNAARARGGNPDYLTKDMFGRHFSYTPSQYNLQTKPRVQPTSTGAITSTNNQRLRNAIQNARDITNMPGASAYRPLVESAASSSIKTQQRYDALRDAMRSAGMKGADENMTLSGKPIKRQGGGEIPQGPFTPLPSPGYVRPQGSFIPRPLLRLPGPMPGTTLPFGYNPFKGLRNGGLVKDNAGSNNRGATVPFGYNSFKAFLNGGLIKENTGSNIPGATADRQLIAAQPGEYVLPVDTVNRLGTSLIDKLVAMTDSNSNPFKTSVNKPKITPLPRGSGNMITLPPITQESGSRSGSGSFGGSRIPSFMAASPSGAGERNMNCAIYGVIG
jgi:hypothetical protein